MTYKAPEAALTGPREADRVVVQGKTEAVNVYEVLDYHTDETFPNLPDVLQCYKAGLSHYRKQEWDKALGMLRECVAMNPQDTLSHLYIERAEWMKVNPPGDDWNGVWVLKSK